MEKITSLVIVLTLAFGVILASSASVGPAIVVFAQKNQTKASPSSSLKDALFVFSDSSNSWNII
jgi:hypothetical protein